MLLRKSLRSGGIAVGRVRWFSSGLPATTMDPGMLTPDLAKRASDIAAFYPRPSAEQKPIERGFRGWKPFGIFVFANVAPVAALIYYFQSVNEEHQIALASRPPQDVAACLDEVTRVIGTARQAFFVCGDADLDVSLVDPCPPESRQFCPPTKAPLGLHENSAYSELAGTYSEDSFPLRAIHFAVTRESSAGAWLASGSTRRSQLIYSGRNFLSQRGADHVVVRGTVAEVTDPKLRQHHWRPCWGATIAESPDSAQYVLLKFIPDEVSVPSPVTDTLKIRKEVMDDNQPHWLMHNTAAPGEPV